MGAASCPRVGRILRDSIVGSQAELPSLVRAIVRTAALVLLDALLVAALDPGRVAVRVRLGELNRGLVDVTVGVCEAAQTAVAITSAFRAAPRAAAAALRSYVPPFSQSRYSGVDWRSACSSRQAELLEVFALSMLSLGAVTGEMSRFLR
jgi:hypothetical protein